MKKADLLKQARSEMGRLGGIARAKSLTAEQRKAIATKANAAKKKRKI